MIQSLAPTQIKLLEKNGIFLKKEFKGKTVVMFPGHGSQYVGMLTSLKNSDPLVAEIINEAEKYYEQLTGEQLYERLATKDINTLPTLMQPAIILANEVFYRILTERFNITPDYVVGHSLGEISALRAAGMITFKDALSIAFHRAKSLEVLKSKNRGYMLSIKLAGTKEKLTAYLNDHPQLEIAIVNSESQLIISGRKKDIHALQEFCRTQQLSTLILPVPYPFHSTLLQDSVSVYANSLKNITFNAPTIPVYSSILSRLYSVNDVAQMPEILAKQLVTPFSFVQIIKELHADFAGQRFIECGCSMILTNLVEEILADADVTCVNLNAKKEADLISLKKAEVKLVMNKKTTVQTSPVYEVIHAYTGYPIQVITDVIATRKSHSEDMGLALALSKQTQSEIVNAVNNKTKSNHQSFNELFKSEQTPKESVKSADSEMLVKQLISDKTGYPLELLDPEADLEADLGIDSVKQAEIMAALQAKIEMPELTSPLPKTIKDIVAVLAKENEPSIETTPPKAELNSDIDKVKEIISDKTGYPLELLETESDLEADLGIDSVKQAEILAELQNLYPVKEIEVAPKTIKEIATLLEKAPTPSAAPISAKKNLDSNDVLVDIKTIISQKTGYPLELLEDNADLEADLGIDSVKQASLMAAIGEKYRFDAGTLELTTVRNIATIADLILSEQEKQEKPTPASKWELKFQSPDFYEMKRYFAQTVDYSRDQEKQYELHQKNILLIGDSLDGKLGQKMFTALQKTNNVVLISPKEHDFLAVANLKQTINEALQKLGKLDCIINLQGLTKFSTLQDYQQASVWEDEVTKIYNGLFYTSKLAYEQLSQNKNSAYFSAVNIGKCFGVEHSGALNPLGALTAGFVKALEKELRPFIAKVVDLGAGNITPNAIELLLQEFSSYGELLEIGMVAGIRKGVVTRPISKEKATTQRSGTKITLRESETVLVTGGGRGITYECAKKLALSTKARLILTGRTDLPTGDEEFIKLSEAEFENYRPKFMLEQKKAHPELTVIEISFKYERLKNARKLYENLVALKDLGVEFEYVRCDFSAENDVLTLKKYLEKQQITLSGIINGAGLPSFGKVNTKNEQATLNVVKVKAKTTFLLYQLFIAKNAPKFVVHMGSISGRFGMDGQVDYSAAADLLVKMSANINHLSDTKSVVIGWPAWDEVGMATNEEVKKVQMYERGLSYISLAEGTQRFLEETLCYSGENEILLFKNLGEKNLPLGQLKENLASPSVPLVQTNGKISEVANFPMLELVKKIDDTKIIAKKELTLSKDLHLKEHLVKNVSVLAGVFHVESAAELALLWAKILNKDLIPTKIVNFRFARFIKVFPKRTVKLLLTAEMVKQTAEKMTVKVTLKSDFKNDDGIIIQDNIFNSAGTIELGRKVNPPETAKIYQKLHTRSWDKTLDIETYYAKGKANISFGKNFQNISAVKADDTGKCTQAKVKVTDESNVFALPTKVTTQINPILIDNVGRLMLLNEFYQNGATIVPTYISEATKYAEFNSEETLDAFVEKVGEQGDTVVYNGYVFRENELVFSINEMQLSKIGSVVDHDISG